MVKQRNMKKLIAAILAVLIVPTFNTSAWVGGPFDNNSYTPGGDDGIYEAVAVPVIGSGMGIYRWGVFNRNPGGTAFSSGLAGNTGNVQFGGMIGTFNQHVWYLNGEVYYGPCFGSVNSSVGTIQCVGNASTATAQVQSAGNQFGPLSQAPAPVTRFARDPDTGAILRDATGNPITTTVGDIANSFFRGQIQRGNYNHAARRFSGRGRLTANVLSNGVLIVVVPFRVFGSRVSLTVTG